MNDLSQKSDGDHHDGRENPHHDCGCTNSHELAKSIAPTTLQSS